MAAFPQVGQQFAVVVYLAVENHGYGAVLVEYRLLAAGNVDHRQTAHAQRDAVGHKLALRIRPTVVDRCQGLPQGLGHESIDVQCPNDTAHGQQPPSSGGAVVSAV
jgi:hypothetical protein